MTKTLPDCPRCHQNTLVEQSTFDYEHLLHCSFCGTLCEASDYDDYDGDTLLESSMMIESVVCEPRTWFLVNYVEGSPPPYPLNWAVLRVGYEDQIRKLRELLQKLEWSGETMSGDSCCPNCWYGNSPGTHHHDCELHQEIQKLTGEILSPT